MLFWTSPLLMEEFPRRPSRGCVTRGIFSRDSVPSGLLFEWSRDRLRSLSGARSSSSRVAPAQPPTPRVRRASEAPFFWPGPWIARSATRTWRRSGCLVRGSSKRAWRLGRMPISTRHLGSKRVRRSHRSRLLLFRVSPEVAPHYSREGVRLELERSIRSLSRGVSPHYSRGVSPSLFKVSLR